MSAHFKEEKTMNALQNFFNNLPTQVYPIASGLAVLCLIIAGIQFMLGKRQKEEGKERVAAVVMGICIVFLALAGVTWLVSFLGTVGGAA